MNHAPLRYLFPTNALTVSYATSLPHWPSGRFFSPLQVVHSLQAGVVEPAMSKVKSLRFATEAAITILRIDDFIKIDPPQQQRR